MSEQHTPGPWRVSTANDRIEVVTVQTGYRIGAMRWDQMSGISLADARLVAAAPDLLEAAKALLDLNEDVDVARRLAEAAVAKTEGRYP